MSATTQRSNRGFVASAAVTAFTVLVFDHATNSFVTAGAEDGANLFDSAGRRKTFAATEMTYSAGQMMSVYREGYPIKLTAGEAIPWGTQFKTGANGHIYAADSPGDVAVGQVDWATFNDNDEPVGAVGAGQRVNCRFFARPFVISGGELRATLNLDFPQVAAGGVQKLTGAVAGARAGDVVSVTAESIEDGLVYDARVSANDTVEVRIQNITGAAIDPAAQDFRVLVSRSAL